MNTTTANQTRRQVCQILGWNYTQYGAFIYERGIAYLQWYLPDLEQQRDQLERSQLFWNWWKNSWKIRDDVFIADIKRMNITNGFLVAQRVNLEIYKGLHCANSLVVEGLKAPKCVIEILFIEPKLKEVVYG